MANEFDDLFNGSLDTKMDFLNEQKATNNDGIYRVDLSKSKDKKKGWRSVVRFLPNLTKDSKVGQSAIEKVTHYVDIKQPRELAGWFDSPKNFNEKCPLTDLYYVMQNSKNAISKLDSSVLKIEDLILPVEESNRTNIYFKKEKETNKKYPRNFSQIKNKPL